MGTDACSAGAEVAQPAVVEPGAEEAARRDLGPGGRDGAEAAEARVERTAGGGARASVDEGEDLERPAPRVGAGLRLGAAVEHRHAACEGRGEDREQPRGAPA
jgi:hypothetical protein